jgi:hypothetical protein
MTIWAVLNQKGWVTRTLSDGVSGFCQRGYHSVQRNTFLRFKGNGVVYAGALAPWLIAAASIIVFGFIQMNLHFCR